MSSFVSKKYHIASLAMGIVTIVIHLLVYPQLPDSIPYHWNFNGEVDKIGPKYIALIGACLPLILYLLMHFSPKIDPKKDAYKKHKKAYSIFVMVIVFLFSCVSFMVLLVTFGYHIPIGSAIGGLLGFLSLVLGNYMRQIRLNYSFGIKTPWSVNSEKNWRKTHRLGSILFAVVGLWLLIGIAFSTNWWTVVGVGLLVLSAGILYVYSYFIYIKERKNENST